MTSKLISDPFKSRSVLFMKVGNHAGESFDAIIARKSRELKAAGRIFWGYGGTACHPLTQVQPFVRLAVKAGEVPVLVMQSINSTMDQDQFAAEEYSEDGVTWKPIPKGVEVIGSRYAMILGEVQAGDFMFDARQFEVGIGPSRGKRAHEYLVGRTDKACLVRAEKEIAESLDPEDQKQINFFAELLPPYAVMLR